MGRHGTTADVPNETMRTSDLWDFGLTPSEDKQLGQYIKQVFTDRSQLSQPITEYATKSDPWIGEWDQITGLGDTVPGVDIRTPNPHNQAMSDYTVPTGYQHLSSLAQRKLLNDWLLNDGGVVFDQAFDMSGPNPQPIFEKRQSAPGFEFLGD